MAAASSGQPFEFDISLDPLLVHDSGKDDEEIEDHRTVYQCLQETHLLTKCFQAYENVRVVKISTELRITLTVSSLEEFEEIRKVVHNGELTKSITEFVVGLGLEVDLGVFSHVGQSSHVKLDVDLFDEKKTTRKAKNHFKNVHKTCVPGCVGSIVMPPNSQMAICDMEQEPAFIGPMDSSPGPQIPTSLSQTPR
ncbi:uncharacterized protein LOC121391057 [Gigantopelta aegis]|uniref:uncharacterized protein LOC121391057 n=1 Tax=Gigantopelta aegis TaxID=1735272 RepID=UPI001B888AF9|nr:uncharacterized protein LOC121391057 [Gigantopelta aegis]